MRSTATLVVCGTDRLPVFADECRLVRHVHALIFCCGQSPISGPLNWPVPRDASFVSVLAAVIALAMFSFDALTPLDIAVAVLYVVVVLMVASTGNCSLQDSGTGISEENAERLFTTFFSTKTNGWVWDCRSAVRSLKRTAAASGLSRRLRVAQ